MSQSDYFREELIQTGGILSNEVFPLEEEISKMRFYLRTMEDFIENQKQNEIIQLELETKNMSKEQKSEFWAWYYPVHWEEIFASNLRSSFLVTIVSFTESKLNLICRDVEIILRSSVKSSDLKGSIFERSKKFLECFGKFTKPSKGDWELISCIYEVRNVFVHNDGCIEDSHRSANHLKQFIKEHKDLSESNNFIELQVGFCFFCLDVVNSFLKTLRDQVRELCEHIKELESKND